MCLRFLTLTQRHILHYPCRETIFGLSCVVFQSSSIEQSLMKMQKHLRYRRLEALVWPSWQWLFGGWSFSCLAFAGPLVTLSWCPFWLLENWFQNSTFHHCHPAQVWTSQHITQPNYRIICFEAINNSIKNNALEPFPVRVECVWFKAWGTTWRCGDMKIGKHGTENTQPRALLKMWVSTLYSDYFKDYEDQIVRDISNVNATDLMVPNVCKQSEVFGIWLQSWWLVEHAHVLASLEHNAQDETCLETGRHANFNSGSKHGQRMPTVHQPFAPAVPCNPDVGRFRQESCESIGTSGSSATWHDYCPTSFRGPERSIRLVRFRSAGGDSLSPLFTFQTVSDRAGSLWSFFHLTLDHGLNYTPSCCKFSDGLCTNALGSTGCWVWTFIGNSLQMQNWKHCHFLLALNCHTATIGDEQEGHQSKVARLPWNILRKP